MYIQNSIKSFASALMLFGLIILSGCYRDEIHSTEGNIILNDNLTLSIKSDVTITDDPIVITEAKALIDEVELKSEISSGAQLQLNPFVINLNSLTSAQLVATAVIPRGTYTKIKFQIHKPDDNEIPPDPEFKTGSSGDQRFSIIIKGMYNGNSFLFKSGRSGNLEISFIRPLAVQEGSRNITLMINPSNWFRKGTTELDPRDPSNERMIEDNIKNSFRRAFKDDNRDGIPDEN